MRIVRLAHVNLKTPLVDETVAFFTELGLEARPGPAMSAELKNYWLHDGEDRAIVHVVGIRPGETARAEGPSRLDHFAIDCVGIADCMARFDARGLAYDRVEIPSLGLTQLNVYDPNGIKVELTFVKDN